MILGNREKLIMQLEEKAKELKILPNFKRTLKSYEKEYFKLLKQDENTTKRQTHNEIADLLLKNEQIVKYENDIYIYDNGVYTRDKPKIEKKIIKLVPDSTSYFREEVYRNINLRVTDIKKINKESGIINFKNGLFSLKKNKLYEHTPQFFSMNQINVKYNPQAQKVQAIDTVLDTLSCGIKERKQTILEMIGYSMTTSVKLQKAFVLYGETARNGKSTLVNIITQLMGKENVGVVPFRELSKNKFAGAGIKNKLLNIGSEMTEEYIEDVSNFKMYITGDELEIEEKFKPRQKISPYAKFIFNANELPSVADKTDGFYRRLQIIPLEYSFSDEDVSKFNFNELVSEEALEYLARISVEAYLNMGKHFANYEESDEEVAKYKTRASSILSFIYDKEYISSYINIGTTIRYADEVYACYKQYCTENQFRAVGRNKFYKEFEKSSLISIYTYRNKKTYKFDLDFYM